MPLNQANAQVLSLTADLLIQTFLGAGREPGNLYRKMQNSALRAFRCQPGVRTHTTHTAGETNSEKPLQFLGHLNGPERRPVGRKVADGTSPVGVSWDWMGVRVEPPHAAWRGAGVTGWELLVFLLMPVTC